MPKITEVKWKGTQQRRARIYLDGEFWITLPTEIIEALGFHPGLEIKEERRAEIDRQIVEEQAKLFCIRSLNWKLQSRDQLRRKLVEREYEPELVERVLDRVTEIGLLDDLMIAEAEARSLLNRGYGRRRAQLKLREHGIAPEVADQALDNIFDTDDEVERALAALGKRYRSADDAQRAFGFLVRRGFTMSAARAAVKTLGETEEFLEE